MTATPRTTSDYSYCRSIILCYTANRVLCRAVLTCEPPKPIRAQCCKYCAAYRDGEVPAHGTCAWQPRTSCVLWVNVEGFNTI